MFAQERLGGLLHDTGIGQEKFVDRLEKTARRGVFNEPPPVQIPLFRGGQRFFARDFP